MRIAMIMTMTVVLFAASGAWAQPQPLCRARAVEGTWRNGYGVRFRITAEGCDRVTIVDIEAGKPYVIDLMGQATTPIGKDGLTFDLKVMKPDIPAFVPADSNYIFEFATVMWKIAGRSGEDSSPGFGLVVSLTANSTWLTHVDGQVINFLVPQIHGFAYEPGKLGNLFDEGMKLAINLLNKFEIAGYLNRRFSDSNLLMRESWIDGQR
jgi:hypothetical protein